MNELRTAKDLQNRYELAKVQLRLLSEIKVGDEDAFEGIRFNCEETITFIERIDAAETLLAAYRALMELACEDVIFFHAQDAAFTKIVDEQSIETFSDVRFSVMVNDLFYPGADCEGFELYEAIPLRNSYRSKGFGGVVRWVQGKRDNQPLRPHVEKRIAAKEEERKSVIELQATIAALRTNAKELEREIAERDRLLQEAIAQAVALRVADRESNRVIVERDILLQQERANVAALELRLASAGDIMNAGMSLSAWAEFCASYERHVEEAQKQQTPAEAGDAVL